MANNWNYEQASPPLNDTKVDRLADIMTGVVDELPTLAINIPDNQIIKNLENRIQDAQGYWDAPDGFNLRTSRADNKRIYLNKQLDVRSLYRFQIPYQENQIYIAEQAITAYLTSETSQPEVSPAQDSPQSKIFAVDLEKVMMAHSMKVKIGRLLESSVKSALNKRVGIIYFQYNPDEDEIVPISLNPEEVILDKNARQGENPGFVARALKMSVNEACHRWPSKQEDIYRECGIQRGTPKQLDQILNIREVWVTNYDKDYAPREAVVYYFGNLVLEKDKNPNWLYARKNKNFFSYCHKPFIFLNFDSDGEHLIDETSAVEQAATLQMVLFKRGRQLMEVADKANGIMVIDTGSGIDKAQGQDLTDDPNQKIFIAPPPGSRADQMIFRLPPPEIPDFLMQDKLDLRTQVHAIMGTPSEFTGSNDGGNNQDETLGQSIMKKNQASGRQDLYVRAIDRFMHDYFNMLVQMMTVWYTEKHFFVYNGGDGQFDYLTISRDLIEEGIAVNVKSGTSLPFDKQRQEAIVLQLLKMDASISLLDAYKLLHMQNPQQLYDNWAKQKTDPMALARDGLDEMDDAKAYIAYIEIMAGKEPKDPSDCSKEFVLSLRKLMLRDDFLDAKKKYQKEFLKYVDKAITSLEIRTTLDIASREGIQALETKQPLPQLPPIQPPPMPGIAQPGMAPMGAPMPPGQQPMPGPMTPPTAPQGIPQPGQPMIPQPGNVTAGLPLPNPQNPQLPPPGVNPTPPL